MLFCSKEKSKYFPHNNISVVKNTMRTSTQNSVSDSLGDTCSGVLGSQKQSCQNMLGHLTEPRTRFAVLDRDTLLTAHSESQPTRNSEVTWKRLPRFIWERGWEEGLALCGPSFLREHWGCLFAWKANETHAMAAPIEDLNNRSRNKPLSRRDRIEKKKKDLLP